MKCFHFTSGETKAGDCDGDDDHDGVLSRKVSWARSLSVASTNVDTRRSEFDSDSRREWAESSSMDFFFTQRRANDLRVFTFSELKSATRGFSRTLMIGEGGFGSVYRGRVRVFDPESDFDSDMDVAVKQLNRNGFQLIFRDLKTSNILLDDEFKAKLSDFGLARQGPTAGLGHISTSVVGTVGYAAPEYVHTGRLTAKSDVWSFGVVLYELITGRRVLERNLPRGEQKLLEWCSRIASSLLRNLRLLPTSV